MKHFNLAILLFLFFGTSVYGQKMTVHGYVKDGQTGETLIGANVIVKGEYSGTVTNLYGFYSLSLTPGSYTLIYSYMGYSNKEKQIVLSEDINITIELEPSTATIEEVVVKSEAKNQNIVSAQMGVEKLNSKTIEKIPVLFGEADVIKAIKLLPGVVSTSETSSNMSVRGGARDQNMVILDEANVYNVSHLLGIFSVFNNDAISSVEMYKGAIPAFYGGRISSILDIRMKEGNSKKFSGVGSIGLLASRLTLEAPIVKDKGSILISGRRTYMDLLMKGVNKINNSAPEVPYYFYDFNMKGNYKINDKHRIFLSGYFGRDNANFDIGEDGKQKISWGNYTGTFRWNYMISNQLFANFTFLASNYNYSIESTSVFGNEKKEQSFKWDAFLKDYGVKADFTLFANPNNTLKLGVSSIYHDFNVGKVNGHVDTFKFDFKIPKYYSFENAIYISNEQEIGDKLVLEYGLRGSMLQNIGSGTIYKLDNYEVIDTTIYSKNEFYNAYFSLEPRFSINYIINRSLSIKAGYSRAAQYAHIASNSNSGTPLDVWMPVGPNVKPQYGDQGTLGLFKNFFDNKFKTSLEFYYKHMTNQIEFKEFSQPYFNPQIESDFRFGQGRAYGAEFLLKKPEGKLTGWISYTLAKSERKIKDIQEKGWYPSPYDHRHNVSIVAMYSITPRVSISSNWVYLTGKPFDAPVARWEYGSLILPYYNGKNGSRYPNYHRMDFGIEIKNKPGKKFDSSWTFSVYNAYNRRNANMVYFSQESSTETKAFKYSMLQRIYSVSYNFKF